MDNKKTQSKKLSQEEKAELESFKKWLTDKKYSPKNQDEVKKYYAQYQKEKAQASAQQAKKAAHGTKLNYFRALKNQCPEGEEPYYYKKGGSVRCGCKGSEITKAQNGTVVEKFKAIRKGSTGYKNDDWTTYDPKLRKTRKMTPQEIVRAKQNQKDAQQGKGEGNYIQPPVNKSEKITKREEPEQPKVTRPKTSTVKKDSSKYIKSTVQKCGGPVEKFKKHFWGGKL